MGIEKERTTMNGWLALSPLAVFLGVYLVSSIIAHDFYSVPITSAFLIAAVYSMIIGKGSITEKVGRFSAGAGDKNVLLMIWIFVMAGAFASVAKSIGSVEATVNLTLTILPGKLILAGLFLAACFISMSIGTSVGTIVALVPIASGIAAQSNLSLPMITALIVGGAFFGDNLSFISDTTIAATTTQGVSMKDKFKTNIWIAGPAAIIVTAVYIVIGLHTNVVPQIGEISFVKLIPYLSVIILALCGMNVMIVLAIGLCLCALIGFCDGMTWAAFLSSVGSGITGMGELIIVTMLAGGMLEIIRHNGGIDFIINGLTKHIKGRRGAEFSIAALVGFSNFCTANNTIAILTTGKISKDITDKFGVDPRKTASILDTFSCFVQGIIPYGAQLLMAASFAGISSTRIIPFLYYPFVLFVIACLAIIFEWPRNRKMAAVQDASETGEILARQNDVNEASVMEIPNSEYFAMLKEEIDAGKDVMMTPKGNSMLPFIRGGRDKVIVSPLARAPKVGDILLCNVGNRFVMHRTFMVKGDEVTLMGDGNIKGTEKCHVSDILGIVTGIIRNGEGKPRVPGEGSFWRTLLPFRRYILAIYRRVLPGNVQKI